MHKFVHWLLACWMNSDATSHFSGILLYRWQDNYFVCKRIKHFALRLLLAALMLESSNIVTFLNLMRKKVLRRSRGSKFVNKWMKWMHLTYNSNNFFLLKPLFHQMPDNFPKNMKIRPSFSTFSPVGASANWKFCNAIDLVYFWENLMENWIVL